MKEQRGTATVSSERGNPEVIGKLTPVASTRRTVVEVEPCECQYCRSLASAARSRHISPLASIDVYSLPDETDVCERMPDRSH